MADPRILRQPEKDSARLEPICVYMRISGRYPEQTFITPEMWDPVRRLILHLPSTTEREPLFVGIDVGIKHDNAARVAVKWDETGEKLVLVSHRIWKPTPTEPLDLENTVEEDSAGI